MSATIHDVAKTAGVSIKTVSRVINQESHVAPATREKVTAAIRACGYSPNLAARRLVQQRNYAICILMYPGFSPPTSTILSRINEIGYEEEYEILIQTYYPMLPRARNKLVTLVNGKRYDGYVITPPCDTDEFLLDLLQTYQTRFVLIDPRNRSMNHTYIAGDDYSGMSQVVMSLIEMGHRRIAFLRGPRNLHSSQARERAYKDLMIQSGLSIHPDWLQETEDTFDGGYTATRVLLAKADHVPTAIVSGHDEAAFGALYAANELGITVPSCLSITGYGDHPGAARVWPGLTTVHLPGEELLELAVRMLLDELSGKVSSPKQTIISAKLVHRGSTAPPPK